VLAVVADDLIEPKMWAEPLQITCGVFEYQRFDSSTYLERIDPAGVAAALPTSEMEQTVTALAS
jgi:hypothetical protein